MATKRLAAILSADVVGFSRLMGADEDGTFEAMRGLRKATDPHILTRAGRIVGTAGDSVLAEFVSVLDAVEAAIAIQRTSREFNGARPKGTEITYRIGINLGDVLVGEDNDIFGDGVNVAARIQGMADPGGICVSDAVYRSVHRRSDMAFTDSGEVHLKNISDPVRVWSIVMGEEAGMTTKIRNPFKGLRAFKEGDATDFHGRTHLVSRLVAALESDSRFLAVVGPSGSGKSSVVRAGLVPAVRRGALPGSESWLVAQMVPGAHPFAELETALVRAAPDPPPHLGELLVDDEMGVLRAVLHILPDEDTELVLLVDQFEEVFSLVEDESVRQSFLAGLVEAVGVSGRRLHIVATMRADFYDGPLRYQEFGELFTANMVNVMPMSAAELESAILEPSRRVGLDVEDELVRALVTDAVSQPGALPLFQYTLTEMFDRRSDNALTLDAYLDVGGLHGALTGKADELFNNLGPSEQIATRQMFLRLVAVREQGEDSRRRVPVEELNTLDVDPAALQSALDVFSHNRLLTFDRDPASGDPVVEVAHEALLREWSRLRQWIDESRSDLHRHGTYVAAVREWQAAGQHSDYLLTGTRLDGYATWAANNSLSLTVVEHEYLDRSLERRTAELAAEEERVHEAEGLRRRARARLIAAATAVVALVAVLGTVLVNVLGSDEPVVSVVYRGRDELAIGTVVAAGIDRAERELGVDVIEINAVTSLLDEFRSASSTGGLVMSIGDFDGPIMLEAAADFPEAFYAGVDFATDSSSVERLVRVIYEEHEGAFLVGAAAALTTQTGTIGFVGGLQTDAIEGFRAGYEAGARSVNSSIEVLSAYIEGPEGEVNAGFGSPNLGRLTATRLYQAGADVVFHAAGGSGIGVLEAAADLSEEIGTHLWFIGVDADEYLQWAARPDLQSHILTSMLKRFDEGVFVVIEQFVNDTIEPGVVRLGLADQGVAFSTSGGFIADIADELEELQRRIVSGEIDVPTSPQGQLLPLLAADPSTIDESNAAQVLEEFIRAVAEGDWDTASPLVAPNSSGPFDLPLRDFFEFDEAFGPEFQTMSCEGTPEGAICSYTVIDDFTNAHGAEPATRTVTALIAGDVIIGFRTFEATDDPELEELFTWAFAAHPEEANQACPTQLLRWTMKCAQFLGENLDEWAAQRPGS